MADDTVTIRFGARIEDLVKGVEGVKEKLAELGEMAKSVGELFAIGFGGREIIEFVKSMGELGETTERAALQLGTSTEHIGELGGIATLTGTSLQAMTFTLERMSLNIQRANKEGFTPVEEALKVIGLRAKDLVGLPADEYFNKLAAAVGKFNPSLNLTNALMQIGGRGVTQMIPTLLQGEDAWRKFQKAIDDTGSVLTEAQTKGMVETNQSIKLLGLSMTGLGATIFATTKPAIDGIITSLTDLVQWLRKGGEEGGYLEKLFNALGATSRVVALAFSSIVSTIQALIVVAEEAALALTLNMTTEEAARLAKEFENIGNKWKETVRKIYAEPLHVEVHGEGKQTAGAMDMGGKDALAAQMAAIQERIKLADIAYQTEAERLASGVKTFQMTEIQKTAGLREAEDTRFMIVTEELQKEINLHGQTAQKIAELQAKGEEEFAEHMKKLSKINDDGLQAQAKDWNTAFSAIQGAWDSQLRGLLGRTETWKEAMKNIFADLVIVVIKAFEKIILEKAALALAAKFMGAPEPDNSKAVASDVGQSYAGFAAYYAPTMGAAALAMAAGLSAAVASIATGLSAAGTVAGGSAEGGAWVIPQDSAWNLHRGEMVLPEKAATTFRNMASGGGGGGTIVIHAMDGASVLRVVNQHAAVFARVIGGHMAANPSTHG